MCDRPICNHFVCKQQTYSPPYGTLIIQADFVAFDTLVRHLFL